MKIACYIRSAVLLSLFFLLGNSTSLKAADGYEIRVQVDGVINDTLFLGFHYGDKQMLRDTALVDAKGRAAFKGEEALDRGVYLVITPKKKYFELIISDDQKFEASTDTSNLSGNLKVKGSKENEIFYDYISFLNKVRSDAESLKTQIAEEKDPAEKARLQEELGKKDVEIKEKRSNIYQENPDLLVTDILRSNDEPVIPEAPVLADGSIDSTFRVRYFKEHYFDSIDFEEVGMVRSPVLQKKMTYYLDKLNYPVPDSVKIACDYLIDLASANEEIRKWTTNFMVNKYAASKIMGMDAVYVHLVEKYYESGLADWIDDASLYRMTERAKTLRPILIGQASPPLKLKDRDGEWVDMLSLPQEYIVIMFWDPDCGHCKKAMPALKEFYEVYSPQGVEIYSVATEQEEEKWLKYLDENEMPWINVADFEFRNNFREVFDVRGTPRIFVLDKERKIIAKQIASKYLGDWLDRYRKEQEKNKN